MWYYEMVQCNFCWVSREKTKLMVGNVDDEYIQLLWFAKKKESGWVLAKTFFYDVIYFEISSLRMTGFFLKTKIVKTF